MRLHLFVILQYESSTIYYALELDILCVTCFLTSITMPDPLTSGVRQNDVSASSGISSLQQAVNSMSKRSVRWGLFKNFFYVHIFSFVSGFHTILSDALISPISQLQAEQVMID